MTAAAPAPTSSDGKGLGIVGLILTFLPGLNLIGFILALVGRSQSKKAGVKNTPATVAIVFGVISIVATIIVIAVVAGNAGALVAQCAELGTGVHELDNGVTVTCG